MRYVRIGFGYLWAAGLSLFGVWVWTHRSNLLAVMAENTLADIRVLDQLARSAALFAIAGAQFLFMVFVADELCPKVPAGLRGFFESFVGCLAVGSLGWATWLAWPMMS